MKEKKLYTNKEYLLEQYINNNKDFLDFLCCNKPYIDQYGELVL